MSQVSQDTARTVSRSSLAFLSGTFLSRVTGVGRDAALAVVFGSSPALAAFIVAFRFANLIRRLFGESGMANGFIPHFEELKADSAKRSAQFFRDLFFSLSAFLLLLIGVLEISLAGILKWGNLHPDNAQILYLTMLMLPGVLFICLFGLNSSFLQCERKYFLTGFAPAAFNVVWMIATFSLKGRDPTAAMVPLSLAVIGAFFMQWAMLVPQTWGSLKNFLNWKEYFSPKFFSPELRQMIKPFFLGIIGIGAVQVNTTLDAIFARYASLEGPAYLWYAIRIEQLPLALFGIALSAALLPPLSRAFKEGAYERYLNLLRFAFRRSFSLIFPCTLALFVLGLSGINLLYGHGDFSQEATYQSVLCLWGYGLGLLPAVFVLLLAPALYAKKDFKLPTIGSIFSVFFNIVLNAVFVFVFEWGAFSIALATSIAAWLNYFFLSYHVAKMLGEPLFDRQVIYTFFKSASCALIAAIATLLVGQFLLGDMSLTLLAGTQVFAFPRDFSTQFLQFIALAGTFSLIFFSYAWVLNAHDVLELIGIKKHAVVPSVK